MTGDFDVGVGKEGLEHRAFVEGLQAEGRRLGFSGLGIVKPEATLHLSFYRDWISRGHHGEMGYLAREDSLARRGDLRLTMAEVRSVVVVTQEYFQEDSPGVPEDPSRGVIARYARGRDYHKVLKTRLQDLLLWLKTEFRAQGLADEVRGLPYVDTGPILERDLARRAGLGWFGKNTMLIHPRRGSFFFIGILLLDLELPPSESFGADRCGTCQACLDACPTGALLGRDENGAPVMDARRCISYLTIEHKGPIPEELRVGMGNRIFGCDICQECCPWNTRFATPAPDPSFGARAGLDGPSLVTLAHDLLSMDEGAFAERFSGSPLKRAKRRGLLRNVVVALGNWGAREAIAPLGRALGDPEPLVRGHAAWALGQILAGLGIPGDAGFEAAEALLGRKAVEDDPWVREELEGALGG